MHQHVSQIFRAHKLRSLLNQYLTSATSAAVQAAALDLMQLAIAAGVSTNQIEVALVIMYLLWLCVGHVTEVCSLVARAQ